MSINLLIYEYQPVGNVRPNDPNLTENSCTEEEFDGEEALSPQRMPCMLTMAHPAVQTTSGAGPSNHDQGGRHAGGLAHAGPQAHRTRERLRCAQPPMRLPVHLYIPRKMSWNIALFPRKFPEMTFPRQALISILFSGKSGFGPPAPGSR